MILMMFYSACCLYICLRPQAAVVENVRRECDVPDEACFAWTS